MKVKDNLSEAIKKHYDWGNLLRAEELAKKNPSLDISKEVMDRMSDLRSWTTHGKPHGYVDPESWEQMPKFQKCVDVMKEHFKGKGVHVLDVGCFTGYFARKLNEFGYDAYGCDIQHKLMHILNVREGCDMFHPVAAENIGTYFRPEVFDAITFLDSLEHIFNDKIAIDAAKRVLKPNGLLMIHVPQGEKYADDSHEHLRLYNEKNLQELCPDLVVENLVDEHGQPTFFGVWKKGLIQS